MTAGPKTSKPTTFLPVARLRLGMYEYSSEVGSPGMGITPARLSLEPLATEGEATRGPDDQVDVDEIDSAGIGPQHDLPAFDGDMTLPGADSEGNLPPLANDLPMW